MKLKKWCALLLILMMVLMVLPFNALAETLNDNNPLICSEETSEENSVSKPDDATGSNNHAIVLSQETVVNLDDWNWTSTTTMFGQSVTLESYIGTSTDVVIPANKDFVGDVEEVHISNTLMKNIAVNKKATSITISHNGDPVVAEGTDWSYVFSKCSPSIISILNDTLITADLSNLNTSNITNMTSMFESCTAMTTLNVTGWDTSSVTNMSCMFSECQSLKSLNLTGWDTSSVTDMSYMINRCSSLTTLDVSGLDTSQVTTMYGMFSLCTGLKSLNVSGLKTGKVTTMAYMFYFCSGLKSLDLTGFDTSKVTTMDYMFYWCGSLTDLDITGWDTSNVKYMLLMFYRCSSLTILDLSTMDTRNVFYMSSMFNLCTSLKTVYVSSKWSTNKVTSSGDMFTGCTSIVGQKGTVYDSTKTDKTYARIDGGPGSNTPGYFTSSTERILKGDINQDHVVDMKDVYLAKRIAMKDPTVAGEYTEVGFNAGDLNDDGKITINEARNIYRAVLGKTKLKIIFI